MLASAPVFIHNVLAGYLIQTSFVLPPLYSQTPHLVSDTTMATKAYKWHPFKCYYWDMLRICVGWMVFTLAVGWILYGLHRSYYDNPWLYGTRWQQWDELTDYPNTTYIWEGTDDGIIDNITFIVMASSVNAQRHISQRVSWMSMAQHVYAFSDQKGSYTMTLPQLSGRSRFADAQQRQPRGMQWMFNS